MRLHNTASHQGLSQDLGQVGSHRQVQHPFVPRPAVATVTVVFDKPFYAEVQLTVNGFIRGDVVFEPGEVNFGEIDQSHSAEQRKVGVTYAGRSDWKIVDVRSAGQHFEVELKETGRQAGRVTYEMLVRLKDNAPAGFFQDQLTVLTDDQQLKSIPLMIQGSVVAPISVSPAALFLGVLEPGQKPPESGREGEAAVQGGVHRLRRQRQARIQDATQW